MRKFCFCLLLLGMLAACNQDSGPTSGRPVKDTPTQTKPSVVTKPAPPSTVDTVAVSIPDLERAYRKNPDDKEAAYDLAYEYAVIKDKKALALADTLLRRDKTETRARAWYVKGTYFNNVGQPVEALRSYDSATIADYQFLDSYLDKGKLLFGQKNYEAALKAFALGQKVAPATADFYFWVARCQQALGDKASAKGNYETAFALDKTMVEARDAATKLGAE